MPITILYISHTKKKKKNSANQYSLLILLQTMLRKFLFLTGFLFFISATSEAQIGTDLRSPSDIVRIAQPGALADTVNVWGSVGRPGRFLVPRNTTIPQILSYSGGPGADWRMNQAGVFRYFSLPQIEIYINRVNENNLEETVEIFTYKYREPFPAEMRNYKLANNEYVTVHIRQRPSVFEYISFGASLITSLLGVYFVLERLTD
jgi:hypothetical protein